MPEDFDIEDTTPENKPLTKRQKAILESKYSIGIMLTAIAAVGIGTFIVSQGITDENTLHPLTYILLFVLIVGGSTVVGILDEKINELGYYEDDTDDDAPAQQTAVESDVLTDWYAYVTLHKELQAKIYHAATDWDTIFYYPVINDRSVPETRELWYAMDAASRLDTSPPSTLDLTTDIASLHSPYHTLLDTPVLRLHKPGYYGRMREA